MCRNKDHRPARRTPVSAARRGDWREATLTLVYGDCSAVLRPASLLDASAAEGAGAPRVRLADLWAASRLPDPRWLEFDFIGAEGFRPWRNGYPPLPGAVLSHGYLQLDTGDLEWDAEAGLACGYRVKGVTMMLALDPDLPRRQPAGRV
jgi:hypothetical protein